MSTPSAPNLERIEHLSEHLRSVLESKIASAQRACATLAQHAHPTGLAEDIVDYEVAASLDDPAEARRLNYEYRNRYKTYLATTKGSETEAVIAEATQTLLAVTDCVRRLENSIRLRHCAFYDVEAAACASVLTYLVSLYHTTRDQLEGSSSADNSPSPAGPTTPPTPALTIGEPTGPVTSRKTRAAVWQPLQDSLLPELSEEKEAEGSVAAAPGTGGP